jgi:hypothetical protein
MVQLSANRRSCIAILSVSLVSFAAITLYIASQRVFVIVVVLDFVMTQSGNFWINTRIAHKATDEFELCSSFGKQSIPDFMKHEVVAALTEHNAMKT